METAIIMLAFAFIFIIVAHGMIEIGQREKGYHEGYEDCQRIHNYYEMTQNDDALIAELKNALKVYLRSNNLYKKGDVKIIDSAIDWKDFKDIAWNMTVFRKESNAKSS